MSKSILTWVSVGLSLNLAACGGDVGTDPEDESAPGDSSMDIGGVTLADNGTDLSGVKVCVESSTDHCTTTDANGGWTLQDLPSRRQLWLSFEKGGFAPTLRPVFLTADGPGPLGMEETRLSPASDGNRASPTLGKVVFQASWPGTTTPSDVSVAMIGVDPDTTRPTYTTPAAAGAGVGFVEVPAGDYLMTFHGASVACGLSEPEQVDHGYLAGFPVAARTGARSAVAVVVRVVAGHVTGPVVGGCEMSADRAR